MVFCCAVVTTKVCSTATVSTSLFVLLLKALLFLIDWLLYIRRGSENIIFEKKCALPRKRINNHEGPNKISEHMCYVYPLTVTAFAIFSVWFRF